MRKLRPQRGETCPLQNQSSAQVPHQAAADTLTCLVPQGTGTASFLHGETEAQRGDGPAPQVFLRAETWAPPPREAEHPGCFPVTTTISLQFRLAQSKREGAGSMHSTPAGATRCSGLDSTGPGAVALPSPCQPRDSCATNPPPPSPAANGGSGLQADPFSVISARVRPALASPSPWAAECCCGQGQASREAVVPAALPQRLSEQRHEEEDSREPKMQGWPD